MSYRAPPLFSDGVLSPLGADLKLGLALRSCFYVKAQTLLHSICFIV